MDKVLAIVIGALFGVGQFFVLRHTLRPLEKGEELKVGFAMFLRLPLPIVLLVGCALVDVHLLAFAGGAFCAVFVLAAMINHLIGQKKKG